MESAALPHRPGASRARSGARFRVAVLVWIAFAGWIAGPVAAQTGGRGPEQASDTVTLDFDDTELAVVIDTIARMTNRNFIYDDRVRGRVTIVSPSPMTVDQAYAVFESVLQVKGFTTVETPGGAIKVVPVRDAKESSIETVQSGARPPNRDRFVTRLIPLRYIDAESIVNTLKPLVSKDAAMAAYKPTNTVILTESASNIRRLIAILESIDVESHKEELSVIRVIHADAATLADQVSEIYGAEVSTGGDQPARRRPGRRRGQAAQPDPAASGARAPVRILTDERTNSLLVLAARPQLEEVRRLVAKLDVPVSGGGRIHVYYLKHANAEELAQTLSGLITGAPQTTAARPPGGGGGPGAQAAIRAAVSELAGGITITADPATNALIIQASQEGFSTISAVIEKLDVERPQVLVEAVIVEVDITDGKDLGFNALLQIANGDTNFGMASATDAATTNALGQTALAAAAGPFAPLAPFVSRFARDTFDRDDEGNPIGSGRRVDAIIRAAQNNNDLNLISAPHILTSDNEQAEIRIGDNIPIVSSRVESAAGQETGLATSVNVERQDIGVTLRVTPQITEGDTLRLEIFQELTQVNPELSRVTGDPQDVGVSLLSRRIENTVVVKDGETVVVGGLISDIYTDNETKVPWLGDIPVLGWAFKTKSKQLTKQNLVLFLTPRIVRSPLDLERETIRKREEFREQSKQAIALTEGDLEHEAERLAAAEAAGLPYEPLHYGDPVRGRIAGLTARYPLQRMREIEQLQLEEMKRIEAEREAARREPLFYLQAAIFGNPEAAAKTLTDLIDSGHDGTLVSAESGGTVMYEIHLGPYGSFTEAQEMGAVIRRSHGLSPAVIVREREDAEAEGE